MKNEEICAVFARNLNNLMARDGLKQRDVVEKLKISKAQVSDWCAGNNVPRTDSLAALVDLFDCKLSDLMTDHDEGTAGNYIESDLAQYLDILKNRPEMRMLFDVSKNATKEQIEAIVHFIEGMIK